MLDVTDADAIARAREARRASRRARRQRRHRARLAARVPPARRAPPPARGERRRPARGDPGAASGASGRRAAGSYIVGSIAGTSALPFLGPYAISKFGLEALADALRVELAPDGIHVSIVDPGTIATPIWTKPQPIADGAAAGGDRALREAARGDAAPPRPRGRRRRRPSIRSPRRRACPHGRPPEDAVPRRPRRAPPRRGRAPARPDARPRRLQAVARRVAPPYSYRDARADDGLPADAADAHAPRRDVLRRQGDRQPRRPTGASTARLPRPDARARGSSASRCRTSASSAATASPRWRGTTNSTMECYFGIPCSGFVLHTLNIRLHPNDLAYIASHGGDKAVDRRPDPRAAARAVHRRDRDRARLRRRGQLRGAARRRVRGRLARPGARRERGGGDVLHERHDRPAERRRLLAPLDDPAHARRRLGLAARACPSARRTRSCRSCRCSTRTPGAIPTSRAMLGAKIVYPGAAPRPAQPARGLRAGARDVGGGRADDLDGDPEACSTREPGRYDLSAHEGHARRRLGGAALR